MRSFTWSFSLAPTLYPSRTFSGGTSWLVWSYKNNCPVEPTPTVLDTSIASNSRELSVRGISFGGMMWVIYPMSSWANASALNPSATSALAPKLELELVIEMSPPDSVTKCSANPIAKTETAWIIELFVTLIWKFLYFGLYLALELLLIVSLPAMVLSS